VRVSGVTIRVYIYIYIHFHTASHFTTLHCIALHYTALHYTTLLPQTTAAVMDNLQITVERIHIRYEDELYGDPVALGE
jgi:hypothetical protein